ncbi:hypothetical protein [Shouchella clausii]|uniref:hypothetical protein n=1 Tax=Shouchella clausii TaxID=79880 RepID=UPI000799F8F8|nr:hypothetical protein [Shouchella clausii]KKI86871.1 hypothetical protein WZ76_08055 [Shouchella clausii]
MNTSNMKLKSGTIKHIENEIKTIKETKKELTKMYTECEGEDRNHIPRKSLTVAFYNKRARKMQDIIDAINETYNEATKDQQKVIELRYWSQKNLTWEGIAIELNMHRNTAQNYKNDFIEMVAARLGWT